jgi:ABC-type uncharacterized transport system substrate-binding protein
MGPVTTTCFARRDLRRQNPEGREARRQLVLNLKTAKTLGITIPQSVLIRADEVMQ